MAQLPYQSWDTEEVIIWANAEQLPYTFLDIVIEKRIDGNSINLGIEEVPSFSERRLALNAYNILKNKGPDPYVSQLIWSFRIMKYGQDCQLFAQHPSLLTDDLQNKSLCVRFQKALQFSYQQLKPKPTQLLKAFYENLHLTKLYPLFRPDFEVELGGENWQKMIGMYRSYGKKQKSNIPQFKMLNTLFNPIEIAERNANQVDTTRESIVDLNMIGKRNSEGSNEGETRSVKPPYLAAEKFNVLAHITNENNFYLKENVEMMFLQIMADTNGEKMWEMEDKMKAIFGQNLFEKEKGLKSAVDLHTTKINQKLKKMQQQKPHPKANINAQKQNQNNVEVKTNENDIEYESLDLYSDNINGTVLSDYE